MSRAERDADGSDRAFALLQDVLPQHALSKLMHRLARSTRPWLRTALIRSVMRAYPAIDMKEAADPDPFAYPSFNAFFTRALRPGARPVASGERELASPVDGTVSQLGTIREGELLQAKGVRYTAAALLADEAAAAKYAGGGFACLYLAPWNYHRIHMPLAGRLAATRYVPGALYSVNDATARAVPGLFARNERVVCEFDTTLGPLAMVLVGALFVGSIETVYAGEINPPAARGGRVRSVEAGIGTDFAKGAELGRFNMGSTVVLLLGNGGTQFGGHLGPGSTVRMGQPLATVG
ncbi:MAG: archaetidylserine decarboxylase [Steroidobacteraceae bacterium]